jgi:hypothetical protein
MTKASHRSLTSLPSKVSDRGCVDVFIEDRGETRELIRGSVKESVEEHVLLRLLSGGVFSPHDALHRVESLIE